VSVLRSPLLMLVTERMRCDVELVRTVLAAVDGGVDLVQLRDKEAPPEALFLLAERMREAIGGRARLLINRTSFEGGRPPADGLHVPENGPPVADARTVLGEDDLVGRSVHSLAAAVAAEAEGADYVVAGTVFASPSHPAMPPAGLGYLSEVCGHLSIPVLAIGGVTPANAADCLRAGAAGVAVLSPVMRAADPERVAAEYRASLDAAWHEEPRNRRGTDADLSADVADRRR
jgi:thiamine-phosphate diphosphorylase